MSPSVETAERLLHSTTSLCRMCKNGIPARIVALQDGAVWMRKECPEHGPQEVRLAGDAVWYERTRAIQAIPAAPPRVARDVRHGCPFDCGPCTSHTQKIRLPVVTITSAGSGQMANVAQIIRLSQMPIRQPMRRAIGFASRSRFGVAIQVLRKSIPRENRRIDNTKQ